VIASRVGLGARARCDTLGEPRYKGRPRCEQMRFHSRPRCEHLGINRIHLDLAESLYVAHGCNCGVCVGIEYFNNACRHLPSPNFFAHDSYGIPLLTVQKVPDHPKSAPPWASYGLFSPTIPLQSHPVWFELFVFWHTTPANPLIMHTFICTLPIP
jgi:hypothetical protein